ncbi:MAG TPA: hypothetical protein EYP29_01690 [Thermoplasmata archaeon]|nr:hypothetical protein [Thermoplasmata archaeon]
MKKIDGVSTVIGNLLMITLTLLLVGIVVLQANQIIDSIDLPKSIDEFLGREKDPEAVVNYKVDYEDSNLTITIVSVSRKVEIPRVNYVLYNLSINKIDETGYLIDVAGANDTKVRYTDTDNDGYFSGGDVITINFGEEDPYEDYLLELRDNKNPEIVYKIKIKKSDLEKI